MRKAVVLPGGDKPGRREGREGIRTCRPRVASGFPSRRLAYLRHGGERLPQSEKAGKPTASKKPASIKPELDKGDNGHHHSRSNESLTSQRARFSKKIMQDARIRGALLKSHWPVGRKRKRCDNEMKWDSNRAERLAVVDEEVGRGERQRIGPQRVHRGRGRARAAARPTCLPLYPTERGKCHLTTARLVVGGESPMV